MPKNNSVNDPGVPHLPLSGGTMTGNLLLNSDPTTSTQAATKNYVDAQNGGVIGAMQYFANAGGDSTFTALGWKKCDGSILSQASYPALFAQVGLLNGPAQNWIQQNSGTTANFTSLHYGNGLFVAYAASNIFTSTDAVTWTARKTPTGQSLQAGAYGNGVHFVGGNGATMLTSTDAISWYTMLPGLSGDIVYNATPSQKYVWLGGANNATSTDGNRWTAPIIAWPSGVSANAIAYGGGLYVMGGSNGNIATSTDGVTWTPRPSATTSTIYTLAYGASKFVAAGQLGVMETSTNGIAWTTQNSGTVTQINKVAYLNSALFLAGGQGFLATSTDAVTWTSRTLTTPATTTINTITFGASVYLYAGSSGNVATSTDAITWTARTFGTVSTINAVTFGNSIFVAVGVAGALKTSTDGITWTVRTSNTTSALNSVVWDGALFHAVGTNTHLTSTDGITWIKNFPGLNDTDSVQAAIYTDKFVIGYFNGGIQTSTDGITWTTRTSNSPNNIYDFAYSGSLYVYAAGIGLMGTSTDGITWTARQTPTSSFNYSVTYGNSLWVAINSAGNFMTSNDAITWTVQTPLAVNPPTAIRAVNFANGLFIAVGNNILGGTVYTSTNGTNWIANPNVSSSTNASALFDVISASNKFVTVGQGGYIYTSPNAYQYATNTQFQLPMDNQLAITQEPANMFSRSLYIKAQ
jgi:hypothetical protein